MNHHPEPEPMPTPICVGVWEDYACECVSITVKTREELPGQCAEHKKPRNLVWPEIGYRNPKGIQ
jgi:hypothetical protein